MSPLCDVKLFAHRASSLRLTPSKVPTVNKWQLWKVAVDQRGALASAAACEYVGVVWLLRDPLDTSSQQIILSG